MSLFISVRRLQYIAFLHTPCSTQAAGVTSEVKTLSRVMMHSALTKSKDDPDSFETAFEVPPGSHQRLTGEIVEEGRVTASDITFLTKGAKNKARAEGAGELSGNVRRELEGEGKKKLK